MSFINKDSDHFFFIEIDGIEKGKDENGNEVMKVKGIASTDDEDSQGEILDPNGFDFKPFLEKGYLNFHHQANKDPLANIGEPTKAFVKDNKFHIEGTLYPDNPMAQRVYELANVLKKNSKTRRLGFSIEGKALEKDPLNPKRITKSLITGCAITHSPINKNTIMDIVKGEQSYDPPIYDISDLSELNIQKSDDSDDDNIFEIEDGENSLVVKKGYKVVLKKGKVKEIKKDFSTQTGKPMIKESLESDIKDLTDAKDSGKKMIKASELSDIIKSDYPNLSDEDIQDIQTLVKEFNNKETNMSKLISQDVLKKAYEALGLTNDVVVVEKATEEKKEENIIIKSEQTEPVVVTESTPAVTETGGDDILDLVKADINERFTAFESALAEKFTAVATLMKANIEAFQAVERRFEQVEQAPASSRKSIERVAEGLKVIEKGFNSGSPLSGQEEDKNVISKATPAGKNTILGLLEKAATDGSENSEAILDKIITFESTGRLDAQTVNYLNEKYKVNIQ
jgi:hypothetical protein